MFNFKGVQRRFNKIFSHNDIDFFDDYAHHPTEIKVVLEGVSKVYKGYDKVCIFQPHRISRLKDLKKTQKKANKFASVVEKVMHLREKEDKQRFYTASKIQRKKSLSSSTTSTTSAGSSSTTKARRPESVAQRVMRERQEKRISARNVVTPPKKKNKVKEPLHLALRKSASKHGRPRAVMAQKIKQKAHFNAVSEFQVRPLLLMHF